MPVAALSDPHMGSGKKPDRAEKIIGGILLVSIVFFGLAGAAYWQNWSPWIFGGAAGVGLFVLGFGLTAWGKYLIPQGPFVEERHTLASTGEERDTMSAARWSARSSWSSAAKCWAVCSRRGRRLRDRRRFSPHSLARAGPQDVLQMTGWRRGMGLVDSSGGPYVGTPWWPAAS